MPKRKEGSEGKEGRQRSKTMLALAAFKTKLRRPRSSSTESEGDKLSMKVKCATLPARVSSLDKDKDSKPRTLYWMAPMMRPLDDGKNTVSRNNSNESVDSGIDQATRAEGSESDSNSSPGQSKALMPLPEPPQLPEILAQPPLMPDLDILAQPPRLPEILAQPPQPPEILAQPPQLPEIRSLGFMYDSEAVERAFGPMKDVGRWYSTYSSQQQLQQQSRQLRRKPLKPDTPAKVELDAEDERLVSRPLPPIPLDSNSMSPGMGTGLDSVLVNGPVYENCEPEGVYEQVEARLMGVNGLMLGLRNLARHGWYWGPITRVEAEERLQGHDDGTFLVRDSSDDRYLLSLSFRSQGKTLHTRIEYSNGHFSFYSFPDSESEGYRSVVELIQFSMEYSKEGVFCFSRARALGSPAVPVRLLKPLSRFNHVRSLQHYCRFVIRQSIRFDMIRSLPLPRHVHGFLEQSQF